MKQQSATGERGEEDRAAEVLSQQQQIIRVVVLVQTVEQRHQHCHCQHSAAVAAAVAQHEQRRGIKTKARQHYKRRAHWQQSSGGHKTQIFLIHFFPHKHMIYPILMESGILTATPFINVSHV